MASNCRYWTNRKCTAPGFDIGHDCNWPDSNYQACAVYKMSAAKSAGGSMEDQLRAGGCIPPDAEVVGGSGRRFTDAEINRLASPKKWWQFWK